MISKLANKLKHSALLYKGLLSVAKTVKKLNIDQRIFEIENISRVLQMSQRDFRKIKRVIRKMN